MSTVNTNQVEGHGGQLNLDKDSVLRINQQLILPVKENKSQALIEGGFGSLSYVQGEDEAFLMTPGDIDAASSGGVPGASADSPANSPAEIIAAGVTTDGGYWINLPSVGAKKTYCALSPSFAGGGGWMLAMKATRGNTFGYDSSYWTSPNTTNENDMSRSDADAKYDVFNYYQASSFLAIFPDMNNGGQTSGYGNGWSWLQGGQNSTALARFQSNQRLSSNPRGENMWQGSGFSNQNGFQWYGFNYNGSNNGRVRWGFGWNNEGNQGSNDVVSGIGGGRNNYSAGDSIYCCQGTTGINRSARMEIWVK